MSSSAMNIKRKQQIDIDLRQLIRSVTGFKERDENFKLCVNFAESNFRYHRYLNPDSHKIERRIEGLCEKFEVHSQSSKAVDVKDLVNLFLESAGLEGKEHGKTDTHYAMLSLLLELADSPTKVDFKRLEKHITEEEVSDFDWGKYLLVSEDLNFMSYASSDTDGDEDDFDEETTDVSNVKIVAFMEDNSDGSSSAEDQPLEDTCSTLKSSNLVSSTFGLQDQSARNDEYTSLANSLVVEYWKGKGNEEEAGGTHVASNLAKDWHYYQQKINGFHAPASQTFVTELQVIKETLWMLSGVTDLFIFKFQRREYSLNPDIYVSHLTTESLECYLKSFMKHAAQVFVLQSFVADVVSQSCHSVPGDDKNLPLTYQAFASCVSEFLISFKKALKSKEKIVRKQEELMTLAKLASDLQPWTSKLDLVHSIYIQGIVMAARLEGPEFNNSQKATLLLNTLYQVVYENDLIGCGETDSEGSLLFSMLIKSSRPFLEMTGDWIANGQLNDPAGEFVVQRNKEIQSLDETFWEKAFLSRNSSINHQDSKEKAEVDKDRTVSNSNIAGYSGNSSWTSSQSPLFMCSFLNEAILMGKSMELLETLGRLGDVLQAGCGLYERPPSLYDLFLEDLNSMAASKDFVENEKEKFRINLNKDPIMERQLNAVGVKNTLLNLNFNAVLPDRTSYSQSERKNSQEVSIPEELIPNPSPLLRLCEGFLHHHVRTQYNVVCPRLVEILKTEYHLMDCIHAMQRYFLMSEGDIMYDFYIPVFEKIQAKDFWQEPSLLDMYLHESVGVRYPEDITRLRINIVPLTKSQARGPINVTDSIHLKYHVPWPVDVVISGKYQKMYNDIFTFLLQIKRSKFTLEQLRFEDLSRKHELPSKTRIHPGLSEPFDDMGRASRIHRFQLLRFRLLYFVNSLHNYIMTRILHSSGLEFAKQLEAATDLEQIISIHASYVDLIHERCLLHKHLSLLKNAVTHVLNLSLTCSTQWRQGVDFVKGFSIEEAERELTRCIHFLSSFLNNVIKRGSFPHLESLAFALVSSLQQFPQP